MEYCETGSHATLAAYRYDNKTWCPQHPCPGGPIDRVPRGTCEIGRIHQAPDGIWWLPAYGKFACRRHMGILVRELIRRSEYGR